MHAHFVLLALIPVALGCLNADSNKCASYIKSNSATASPFCASFTKSVVTATTALPAWATNCDNKPKLLSAECSCHYTAGGSPTSTSSKQTTATPTTIVTRTTTAAGTGTAPTGVTTVLPQSSGAVATNTPILVSGSLDGGMKLYDRSRKWFSYHKCTSENRGIDELQHASAPSRMRRARPMPCSFSKMVLRCLMSSSGLIRLKESIAVVNGESEFFRCPTEFPQLTFGSTL